MKLSATEKEKFHLLLMAAIDGELSAEETPQFEKYVREYPECHAEWQKYLKLKEITQTMQFTKPAPELWDHYWADIYHRLERGLGWIVFSIGCVILLTYGGFKAVEAIIADRTLEWIVKVGIIAVIGGLMMLFVSVLREKIFMARTDKYQKEVQR